MQAFSGIMSITGEPGGQPVRRGRVVPRSLHRHPLRARCRPTRCSQREQTGLGQRVDGSLLETAVSLLAFHAEGYLLTGAHARRRSAQGTRRCRPTATSSAGDGQWIFIAAANDRFWQQARAARSASTELAADPALRQERRSG